MKTDDLIKALSTDTRRNGLALGHAWALALVSALCVAAVVFISTLGVRPDLASAAHTVRFLFKPTVALVLSLSAVPVLIALSRPGATPWAGRALLVAPLLLAAAFAVELAVLPAAEWRTSLVGSNALVCLTYIPLIGLGPLVVFMAALRHGAPTRRRLAGATAGLLAGGLAASLYALHCPDDSPLFVATWYSLAVLALSAVGALGGRVWLRW
jgi:hypothetical protein